jgi:hypothetical protein
MADYVTADKTLPRSLDVQITVNNPQTSTRTDLSTLCLVCEDLGLLPNANRLRWYSDIDGIENDYGTSSEPYRAGVAFFGQTPRATTMAVGEIWLSDVPAMLVAPEYTAAEITAIRAESTGNLKLTIGETAYDLNGMDFTADDTLAKIATRIQGKLTSGTVPATATVKTLPGGSARLAITTTTDGDGVTISYPITTGTGVFAGTVLKLTEATGCSLCNGYTPTDIASELANIKNAAKASEEFIYGWCLESGLRDATIQTAAAGWALAQDYAIMPIVSSDASAPDPTYELDFMSVYDSTANRRIVPIYHDNLQQYPDVSILAYMLHVNYRLPASVVTAKFKLLPGITTVDLTETEYTALKAKGYNVYTNMGSDIYTYREGSVPQSAWWMDSVINMDNFVVDLQTEVFNTFLRNKKIPYTRQGQMLLVDACKRIGNLYAFNGTFADREVEDTTRESGYRIVEAVQVIPTPIWQVTSSDRVARTGPPIQMIVQDSGAIHSIAINVDLVS